MKTWIQSGWTLLVTVTAITTALAPDVYAFELLDAGAFKVWKVSGDLPFAAHQYYNTPAWNANGSIQIFKGKGRDEFYRVDSLTSPPRQFTFETGSVSGFAEWSVTDPNVLFFATNKDGKTLFCKKDMATGSEKVLTVIAQAISFNVPPHPDGLHVIMGPANGLDVPVYIYNLITGMTKKIPLTEPAHRIGFVNDRALSFFYNTQAGPRKNYLVDYDSGKITLLHTGGASHPHWNATGEYLSFFESGKLMVISPAGKTVTASTQPLTGHQSWVGKTDWCVMDIPNKHKFHPGEIALLNPFTGDFRPVVRHEAVYGTPQYTHPHVSSSPDGTKIVYNSSNRDKQPEVRVVQIAKPENATHAVLTRKEDSIRLEWATSPGAEIREYKLVKMAGGNKSLVASVGRETASFEMPYDQNADSYQIVACEFSGLESDPVEFSRTISPKISSPSASAPAAARQK